MIKSVISQILYDKSKLTTTVGCEGAFKSPCTPSGLHSRESFASEHKVFESQESYNGTHRNGSSLYGAPNDGSSMTLSNYPEPSIVPMLQTNSKTQLLTNQKRFSNF